MTTRDEIAEAALSWFRASQEWQEKSARGEPVCYDKVGKLLGELVELCRKHEASLPKVTKHLLDDPPAKKSDRLDDWQPYL